MSIVCYNKSVLSHQVIQKIINQYCAKNPRENIKPQLNNLLKSGKSCTSRKNFFGHITASAIVLDPSLSKILLIRHKIIGKLFQPGGHVDEADLTLRQAAMRELKEETGYTDIIQIPFDNINPDVPLDIDIHLISENRKKTRTGTSAL